MDTPTLGQPGALTGDSNTAVGFNGSTEYTTVPYSASLNPRDHARSVGLHDGRAGQFRAVVSNRDYATGATRARSSMPPLKYVAVLGRKRQR